MESKSQSSGGARDSCRCAKGANKRNETQIKVSELLELTDQKPLFGHISGKRSNTHWITFMKVEENKNEQ